MKNPPSTEERVWAVFSHLSALALGVGLLLPVVAWSDQRRKSNYAAFQALQALGYQSLGYTLWFLLYLLLMIVFIVVLIIFGLTNGDVTANVDGFMSIALSVLFLILGGSFGLYLLLPVSAAIACALGRDFRYPVMGTRLARYLGYDPRRVASEPVWLLEDHESRWVASMGHFGIIIMLWGLLAPLTALVMHGARDRFLKFQSIQTLIYQGAVTVLFFGALMLYLVGIFFILFITGVGGGPTLETPAGMIGVGVFLVAMLVVIIGLLALPLFHLLGQWAGYRVLKGDDYRYPLVGRLTEKWFMKNTHVEEEENLL